MALFGGKWNSRIICVPASLGTLRYSAPRREMGNITDAVPASTLKELIANDIVTRRSYDEIPPRVEYALTEKGASVVPILQSICQWAGAFYKDDGDTPPGAVSKMRPQKILGSVMQFMMLLLPGLVQGAQPLLSYNLGAGNLPRVKKTFRLLLGCCVGGSFFIWLLYMTAPGAVTSVFTDNRALIAYTAKSMRVYLAMLLIYGVQVACRYSFVALDRSILKKIYLSSTPRYSMRCKALSSTVAGRCTARSYNDASVSSDCS